jgi:predicted RNase H-like HicB family nuclease
MSGHLIIIEEKKTGFSAYSPDLDGCVATGKTRQEVEQRMQKAIEFHLKGLKQENLPIPKPHYYSSCLEISF